MPTVEAPRETDVTPTMGSKTGSVSEGASNRGPDRNREVPGDTRYQAQQNEEEGVEVVLSDRGTSRVVDDGQPKSRSGPNQNVFRHPQAVRPRAMRAPNGHGGPPPHPHLHGSGSWGYGPPQHGDYPPPPPPPRPYPVPYNPSGSFDEQGSHHHHTAHYSPHVQYPPPGGRFIEDVNVISPNHKGDPHYRPALAPRPRHLPPGQHYNHYQYPPTSPVSRPGGPHPSAPPRLRNYAMRRGGDGPYSKAQRAEYYQRPEDGGGWNPYPARASSSREAERPQPPLVAESSFDSEHHSRSSHSHASPGAPPPPPPPPPRDPRDPHYQQFYGPGAGASFGSFDSAAGPPPHFDDQRYYGFPPPDSPYSSAYAAQPFNSPGGIYPQESFPPPMNYGPPHAYGSYSYDDDDQQHMLRDYHPDRDGDMNKVTPQNRKSRGGGSTPVTSNTAAMNMLLPKAADEIDFDCTDPPSEPVCPPSTEPMCESLGDVNKNDVLCGRGGGTNSQVGNRRFRKLVQDFQPTYLLARRKEKPLLARTIVLIIRKRGGRFLKKDDTTGEMFEVGDIKAEAKTSQALREGLDVRATKSAASSLLDKKKKKHGGKSAGDDDEDDSLDSPGSRSPRKQGREDESLDSPRPTDSPPILPRLQGDEIKSGVTHPHSPDGSQFRKRRRMPPTGYVSDKFFPDFCPPRADIGRTSPLPHQGQGPHMGMARSPMARSSPLGRAMKQEEDDSILYDNESVPAVGCGGIALDMVTGAATGSFCLGPSGWRR
jgi:hypothetical protein